MASRTLISRGPWPPAPPCPHPLRLLACACTALVGTPVASQTDEARAATLPAVTVTGRAAQPPADFAGFGDTPLERLPMQVLSLGEALLKDSGAQGLQDLTRFDASVGDAYNAIGYTGNLTVRGFVIDPRFNYRRDGLPISAETALPLDNKSRLELLKGTSGMQAGTSAPGGLVNLVVKRPDTDLRSATIELRGAATALASTDLSTRFGNERAFGLRVNAAVERLDPELDDARGKRHLLAVAGDWRVSSSTFIEAELEWARRSQPSQPGFSLLGDRVPDANDTDPHRNLNDQPWTEPVVFASRTASLRLTQRLSSDWRAVLHAGTQRLVNDDRTAFPFGCSDDRGTAAPDDDVYYADRYCPDGRFDLYDFRSDNERRNSNAIDASLQGRLRTGPLTHALAFGVQRSAYTSRFEGQAFNFVGQGNVDGSGSDVPPDPTRLPINTNRTERNTELYLRDALQLAPDLGLWLGARHIHLRRGSVTTAGAAPSRYRQSFTTPWLALSWSPSPADTLYASWGRGVESEVVPSLGDVYANPGQSFARKSRQTELGYKRHQEWLDAGITLFEIEQPAVAERTLDDGRLRVAPDGQQVHRGLEANAQARLGPWTLGGSAQWLRARREGSDDPTLDGSRPTNVPARSLRLQLGHEPAALPGLRTYAALSAESDRVVLPGNDRLRVSGWARIDLGASYRQQLQGGQRLLWRAGVDNVADRRAWKESPYQFGHVYLYPMAPRTWRVSLQADL